MKSRLSRILLSILILSLALQTFSLPAQAQSEPNENQAEIENLSLELVGRHQRHSGTIERPDAIPPSPEIVAKTKAQVADFDCSTVTEVPEIECEALVALYASTNGAGWYINDSWLEDTKVSKWVGVMVSNNRVVVLTLFGNHLTGRIPAELGNLPNLLSLDIGWNNLTGSIPAELGNLSNLKDLYLDNTLLTGSIPLSFVKLANLDLFTFSDTNLCEPKTPDFIAWKNTVEDWEGTGVVCEDKLICLPLIFR